MRYAHHLYFRIVFILSLKAEVVDFFNAAMVAAKLVSSGVNAIVGCQMNHEKNYAFIEFRSPEEATSAMAFDGLVSFRSCSHTNKNVQGFHYRITY